MTLISSNMTVDEKIEQIVRNCACVIRIVPVRTTSYTHLRDAFMRALQARMALGKKNGTLTEDEAQAVSSPMRKLKSLFPNSPLEKHSPLDIFLSEPSHERPRTLIFRDLGAIESDWVATEFVLHYFEGAGPSPPLKKSVVDRLEQFENQSKEICTSDDVLRSTHVLGTEQQVDHFLDHGFVIIKNAFTEQQAAEWTANLWVRLGMDPTDRSTWNQERVHMPWHRRERVADFAPKAWDAIIDLLGGEDRIDENSSAWGDSFIVNLGTEELQKQTTRTKPQALDNWHVDGDFFVHYLDSPEQALLVIPIYSDIQPGGGGTMICPDGIRLIARYLAGHPEGVLPTGLSFTPSTTKYSNQQDDPGYWSHLKEIRNCETFFEMTGQIGDVVLMHPLMMHSASKNYARIPRVITNPPVSLRKPFNFNRVDTEEYSLVELKTLRELGVDRLDFTISTERRMIVPARVAAQNKALEEEKERLAIVTI
ncbi:hypothetical protein H0H93_012032 [Arthromyces matolae]|nr:hypothetical protein H0H93_012032 [Arthromyces matolae]